MGLGLGGAAEAGGKPGSRSLPHSPRLTGVGLRAPTADRGARGGRRRYGRGFPRGNEAGRAAFPCSALPEVFRASPCAQLRLGLATRRGR